MGLPLGRDVGWPKQFDPSLLCRIERPQPRTPFHGFDRWVCYELSWLDSNSKPQVGIAEISVPARSPGIVESKSLKLFLGSFALQEFASWQEVRACIAETLSLLLETPIEVYLHIPETWNNVSLSNLPGICIDDQKVSFGFSQTPTPQLLGVENSQRTETLHTHLFRSLCPVTSQPDYASVVIDYSGFKIDAAKLLHYLISFREHQDFHEACCERIFTDLLKHCRPSRLTVQCLFTRRGGIEINPVRHSANVEASLPRLRQWRQ